MEVVYDRWGALTYSLAFSILRDAGKAEDVTLEAYLHLWQAPCEALARHDRLGLYLVDTVVQAAEDLQRQSAPAVVVSREALGGLGSSSGGMRVVGP